MHGQDSTSEETFFVQMELDFDPVVSRKVHVLSIVAEFLKHKDCFRVIDVFQAGSYIFSTAVNPQWFEHSLRYLREGLYLLVFKTGDCDNRHDLDESNTFDEFVVVKRVKFYKKHLEWEHNGD